MNAAKAEMKLIILQENVKDKEWVDVAVEFINKGIPKEVITRLQELWEATKNIGRQIYQIGKIVVIKILEFILANPNMAIGAVIGVAVGSLVSFIPLIGPFLTPVAMAIGGFMGTIAGHKLDKIAKGDMNDYHDSDLFSDLITSATIFFELISEIFNSLTERFNGAGMTDV